MPQNFEKARAQRAEIESVCRETGWSQKDLADQAGLKPGTLHRVSSGWALSAASIQSIRNAARAANADSVLRDEAPPYSVAPEAQIRSHVEGLIRRHSGDSAKLFWLLTELRERYPLALSSGAGRALDTALSEAEAQAADPPARRQR